SPRSAAGGRSRITRKSSPAIGPPAGAPMNFSAGLMADAITTAAPPPLPAVLVMRRSVARCGDRHSVRARQSTLYGAGGVSLRFMRGDERAAFSSLPLKGAGMGWGSQWGELGRATAGHFGRETSRARGTTLPRPSRPPPGAQERADLPLLG